MDTAIRGGGLLAAAITGAILIPTTAFADGSVLVTNGKDAGPGSLRDALETQEASHVFIAPSVSTITLERPLEYAGRDALTLEGSGQTLRTERNVTLLAVTEGADLSVSDLAFEGRGDFSIERRGDTEGPAGKGIFVDVRDDQTGMVDVRLERVSVAGVAGHGVHVSDCSLADDCGGGAGGGGQGAPASISVTLDQVRIDGVGYGRFDADGVRVDERGDGGIYLFARDASFADVGADGLELDEGDAGDVFADVLASDFRDNGGYCSPELLGAALPEPAEREFAPGEATPDDVPAAVSGTLDDRCIEREVSEHDDGSVAGYEFALDLDDGIDLDEAGPGMMSVAMRDATVRGNLDEGVDFDEGDAGGVTLRLERTRSDANRDDGFKLSETGSGDVTAALAGVSALRNGGKGVVLEEESDGALFARADRLATAGNDDGDATGIEAVQEGDHGGTLRLERSSVAEGMTLEGVEAEGGETE